MNRVRLRSGKHTIRQPAEDGAGIGSLHTFGPGEVFECSDETYAANEMRMDLVEPSDSMRRRTSGTPGSAGARTGREAASETPTSNATPEAADLAEEEGIDLATVTGTLSGGKVGVDDVRAAIEARDGE